MASDPYTTLRAALEDIANRPVVERNPDGDDQAAYTMQLIACEALDAAPEPEWEYRVVSHDGRVMATPAGGYRTIYDTRKEAEDLATYFAIPCRVDRRRVAGRPGPWEAIPDAE